MCKVSNPAEGKIPDDFYMIAFAVAEFGVISGLAWEQVTREKFFLVEN